MNIILAEPPLKGLWSRRVTSHAASRCRQRGIRDHDLALLIEHGDAYHAGGGDVAFFLGRRAAQRARKLFGIELDHLRNSAVIMLPNGTIRTVVRQCRPRQWWKPAGRRHQSTRLRRKGRSK